MKKRIAGAALLLPLALTGARHPPKDPLAGMVAGKPVDCIDPHFLDGPSVVDGHTIIYYSAGRAYRTGPVDNCPGLEPISTLIIERFGSQLCRNDRFRVRRPGEIIPGRICRFSSFTPYTKPGRQR